uniref:Protein kinase domain-containing protein n=2 Tax=Strongyloides stercoralis TaxID=6248 RepID=A0A0K0DZ99_STRER
MSEEIPLYGVSPKYCFLSPKYEDAEDDYDEQTVPQTPMKKDKTINKKKNNKKNSDSVKTAKSRKSKNSTRIENKRKSDEFLKAIEENNPFKDDIITNEEKELRESILNLRSVENVDLIYEPVYKPVRDIGLKMASETELEESYNRVHNVSLGTKNNDNDDIVIRKNTTMEPVNSIEVKDTTPSNTPPLSSKASTPKKSTDSQNVSCEILELLHETEDSNKTIEPPIFMDSTNLIEKIDKSDSKILETPQSTGEEIQDKEDCLFSFTDDSKSFLHIEVKNIFHEKETEEEVEKEIGKENKNKELPNKPRESLLPHKKPRRNVPVRCVETVVNNHNESTNFFQQSTFLDNEISNDIDNNSIVELNQTSLSKRKSIDEDYPGSPKKQLVDYKHNESLDMSRYFSDVTQEEVPLYFMTIDDMLKIMGQEKLLSFRKLFPSKPYKVGEGSFGEVYSVKQSNGKNIVYKITPFEPDDNKKTIVNGDTLKGCRELAVEFVVTNELSKLSEILNFSCDNFVKLYKAYIVQGMYPKVLLDAWKRYKNTNEVYNEDPSLYRKNVNHYMIFELEDAGIELEKYNKITEKQAYSLIFQLIHCLRIAEEVFQFEHRDLHESNILIQEVEKTVDIDYTYSMKKYKIKSYGIKIKIIDYSLSRLTLNNEKYYLDLEKVSAIFRGDFDSDTFQRVYKDMRELVKNDWSKFCSKNNLLWIIYHVKRLFSLKKIMNNDFLNYFVNDVPKMVCLEELFNDTRFIEFQKTFII